MSLTFFLILPFEMAQTLCWYRPDCVPASCGRPRADTAGCLELERPPLARAGLPPASLVLGQCQSTLATPQVPSVFLTLCRPLRRQGTGHRWRASSSSPWAPGQPGRVPASCPSPLRAGLTRFISAFPRCQPVMGTESGRREAGPWGVQAGGGGGEGGTNTAAPQPPAWEA